GETTEHTENTERKTRRQQRNKTKRSRGQARGTRQWLVSFFRVFRVFRGLNPGRHGKGGSMWLRFEEETYAIPGAAFEGDKDKGCGFLEAVYQECLELELEFRKIPFVSQVELQLTYKGHVLKQKYQPDFICFEAIDVEIKAVSDLTNEHRAQLYNYLKATGHR